MASSLLQAEQTGATPGHHVYEDFEIEVQRELSSGHGSQYPVSVIRSPAGETRSTMIFPFHREQLAHALLRLEHALLRSGGQRRSVPTPDETAVEEFGSMLFNALIQGEVRTCYDVSLERANLAGRGLRLKLRINAPELAALPWEFMYDARRGRYLALSKRTPIVRYLELPQSLRPLAAPTPLRILGMIANPSNLDPLDIAHEKQRMEKAVEELSARGLVELTWLEGETWRDLQRAMYEGPWHIFHFVGHGYYDPGSDEGYVALADESGRAQPLSATKLAHLLTDHPSLRLVLLNVCEGAKSGEHSLFSSTASILVRQGLPAVLAMQYQITDHAAIECARSFYQALAFGLPVDAAVAEARKGISLQVTNSLEWGVPVLYMRTDDGALFEIEDRTQTLDAVPDPAAAESIRPTESRSNPFVSRTKNLPREAKVEASNPTPANGSYSGNGTHANGTAHNTEPPGPSPSAAQSAAVRKTPLGWKSRRSAGGKKRAAPKPQKQSKGTGSSASARASAIRRQFQLFPNSARAGMTNPVRIRLLVAYVASWLIGLGIYWFMGLSIEQGSPWVEALAWSAVGIVQFSLTRSAISWAGQWVVTSSLGWSLGWLIGWSLNWKGDAVVFGDAVWAIMGAIAYTIGALLVSVFRRENWETKAVTVITAAIAGMAFGYGLWYKFGSLLNALWPLFFSPLAIYALVGLVITVLYLSVFNQGMRWYVRILYALGLGLLIGAGSWGTVSAAGWLQVGAFQWTRDVPWLRAGNLAGVLAGVQVVIALESVRRRQWSTGLFMSFVVGASLVGGILPGILAELMGVMPLMIVGSVLVALPLPLWSWLYEEEALILQLSTPDRQLAHEALSILRLRGWTQRPLLESATLRGANLSELNFAGFNLSRARLVACDLSKASLKGVNLRQTDLSGSLLIGSNLTGANLAETNLANAVLTEALLHSTNFRNTDLSQTDLHYAIYDASTAWPEGFDPATSGAIGPGAALRTAILSGIDLSGCDLSGATLIRADLSHSNLSKANLSEANLRAADLKGADLSGAQLRDTNLKDARFDESTRWPADFKPVAAGAVFVKKLGDS